MMKAWWRESGLRRMMRKKVEDPKIQWSELSKTCSNLCGEEVVADNWAVFRTLQSHPEWGQFFQTLNKSSTIRTMVVGEKFAEGGQAQLFDVHVTWKNSLLEEYCSQTKTKFVLKIFKEGTSLRHLQGQWPHGFLKWAREHSTHIDQKQRIMSPSRLCKNNILNGTMLEDGRFAFLMLKMEEDLQCFIKRKMQGVGHDCGPFSKEESEIMMYKVALGVLWLHEHDIVHRDLKAANVLVGEGNVRVADFECSIGVVGTGFWRAPEILQASKDYIASEKLEFFTKAGDIYSYGMVCFEILTGKEPFENEKATRDLVIGGQRPMLPAYVNEWVCTLLHKCWSFSPEGRPSIQEILSIIATNTRSKWIKESDVARMNTKVTDVEVLQLGCENSSHTFERMECVPCESGVHNCRLCLEVCNEDVYKSASCTNCYLHQDCAFVTALNVYSGHPHVLVLAFPFNDKKQDMLCDGCGLEIGDERWFSCPTPNCKYDLHVVCAKYVERISHPIHKEHKLLLYRISSLTNSSSSIITCGSCMNQIATVKTIYHCEECEFNMHPKCAIGIELHRCKQIAKV